MKLLLYRAVYAVWYLLSLLPFWVHYVLSDFIYIVLYKVAGYRVKVVRGNLESSFPEKTTEELRQIERRFYHSLCDYFVETVKMMSSMLDVQEVQSKAVCIAYQQIAQCTHTFIKEV